MGGSDVLNVLNVRMAAVNALKEIAREGEPVTKVTSTAPGTSMQKPIISTKTKGQIEGVYSKLKKGTKAKAKPNISTAVVAKIIGSL